MFTNVSARYTFKLYTKLQQNYVLYVYELVTVNSKFGLCDKGWKLVRSDQVELWYTFYVGKRRL